MNVKITIISRLVLAVAVTLMAGCRSARYKKEAEGLRANETVAAVAVEGVPGGAVVDIIEVQAKVLGINYKTREVKLLIPGGSAIRTRVDEAAVNFDQVKVGDIVNAVITEEIVFQLAPSASELKDHAEVLAVLSDKGEMPAGLMAAAVRISATIVEIDAEARTIKLKLDDGNTKTLTVREDVEMNSARVGDQVVIDLFEAIAVSVDRVEKKK